MSGPRKVTSKKHSTAGMSVELHGCVHSDRGRLRPTGLIRWKRAWHALEDSRPPKTKPGDPFFQVACGSLEEGGKA